MHLPCLSWISIQFFCSLFIPFFHRVYFWCFPTIFSEEDTSSFLRRQKRFFQINLLPSATEKKLRVQRTPFSEKTRRNVRFRFWGENLIPVCSFFWSCHLVSEFCILMVSMDELSTKHQNSELQGSLISLKRLWRNYLAILQFGKWISWCVLLCEFSLIDLLLGNILLPMEQL